MGAYTPKYPGNTSRKNAIPSRGLRWVFRAWQRVCRGSGRQQATGRPAGARIGKSGISRLYIVFLIIALLSIPCGWWLYGRLASSAVFRLTELSVRGNHMVSRRQLLEKCGLRQGMSLLGFDTRGAQLRMQALPWVQRVTLHIVWPSRVEITVREHHPLALVHFGRHKAGRLYYMDRDGHVFAPVQPGQDLDFPILSGKLDSLGLVKKHIMPATPAFSALSFLRFAARGNAVLPVQAISEIYVDAHQGLIVYLVDRPFPIYVGKQQIQKRYYRLVKILERLYRKKKIAEIKEIHMNYMENRVLVATAGPGR